MIMSWRIPMLTEKMMAATLKAAAEQHRDGRISQPSMEDAKLAGHLVRRLTEMGYVVYVDRAA